MRIMIIKILLSVFIIVLFAFVVVATKAYSGYKIAPFAQNNILETVKGIPSIAHENASKRISESINGAEKALENAKVSDFSVDSFLNTFE